MQSNVDLNFKLISFSNECLSEISFKKRVKFTNEYKIFDFKGLLTNSPIGLCHCLQYCAQAHSYGSVQIELKLSNK